MATAVETYGTSLANERAELTEAERRVIEIAQVGRGCAMLIMAECAESGLIRKTADGWDLSPGAKELAKFLRVELKPLAMLGLDRRVSVESDPPSSVVLYLPKKN